MPNDYPDYQKITEWLGDAIASGAATSAPGGAGTVVGTYAVGNYQGMMLQVKPAVGAVTATLRYTHSSGQSALIVPLSKTFTAGTVAVEVFPVYGDTVELTFVGGAGRTVTWALIPANTIGVVDSLTSSLAISRSGILIGNEPGINFIPSANIDVTMTDDASASRVDVTFTAVPAVTVGALSAGPPASPTNNDLWIATDVGGLYSYWAFRYNSGAGAYPWIFVGGAAQRFVGAMVVNLTPASTWVTVKSLTIERAGVYQVRGGFRYSVGATNAHNVFAGIKAGSAGGTAYTPAHTPAAAAGGFQYQVEAFDEVTATAGGTIHLSGQSNSTTGGTDATVDGHIDVVPVRIA